MLLLFLLLVLIGGCSFVIGNALLFRLDPGQCFDRTGDRAIISTWIGVLILANSFLTISLFGPLIPQLTIPAILLILGISLWSRQSRKSMSSLLRRQAPGTIVGTSALTLGVAAYCSQIIVWYDSGLYHVQVIKWLSEFGLVPGLALIHDRFGFISSWFALSAPLNHGILDGRVAALPAAFCLLLFFIHALISFLRIAEQRARTHDLFIVLASLPLALFVGIGWAVPNSPSPDAPVIVLTLVIVFVMLAISSHGENHNHSDTTMRVRFIPLVLAVGAMTIKFNALPLVAVAFCYYLFTDHFSKTKLFAAGSLVALVLALIATAGIVTSGCAFYPVSSLCTDVPWSLGSTAAAEMSTVIQEWARWSGTIPANATSLNWILPWIRAEKLCAALILCSFLALVILVATPAKRAPGQSYIIALGVVGIAFMFYGAPTLRFGMGYVVLLPSLVVARYMSSFSAIQERLNVKILKNFVFLSFTVATFLALHALDEGIANRLDAARDNPQFNLLLPPPILNRYYEVDAVTGKILPFEIVIVADRIEDVLYYRPENTDQCWDAPLPCANGRLENVRLRQQDKGIASGFVRHLESTP